MKYYIYTYDKETERKTGAFTMFIFAICLLLLPLFIMVFDGLGVSLAANFLKNADVPVYAGLETESMGAVITFVIVTFVISGPIIFAYPIAALKQLLVCYVELENGDLVKLRWQPKPSQYRKSYIFSNKISEVLGHEGLFEKWRTFDTVTRMYGARDAIKQIQNPQLIADYVEGRFEGYQIEDCLLGNIQLIKQTKKKIVIIADVMVKGKLKRKKQKIYCIYRNMDRLTSICERRQIQ